MTDYTGGTTTVTLTANVPDAVAEAAGLNTGADRQAGAVHKVRHDDAMELVQAGVAEFGSAAQETADVGTMGRPRRKATRVVGGTTGALQTTDAERLVETSNASAVTLTIPTHATAPIRVGSVVRVRQYGTGQVTVVGASGVTVRGRVGLKTAGQYAEIRLVKRADNEWVVGGEAAA